MTAVRLVVSDDGGVGFLEADLADPATLAQAVADAVTELGGDAVLTVFTRHEEAGPVLAQLAEDRALELAPPIIHEDGSGTTFTLRPRPGD